MEALKDDFYKGPQYFRKCDHQSVQSVLIVESKSKDMKTPDDVFTILGTEEPDEARPAQLRRTRPQGVIGLRVMRAMPRRP